MTDTQDIVPKCHNMQVRMIIFLPENIANSKAQDRIGPPAILTDILSAINAKH